MGSHWWHTGNGFEHHLCKWWWSQRSQIEKQSLAQSALLVMFTTHLTLTGTEKPAHCGLSQIHNEQRKLSLMRRSEGERCVLFKQSPACVRPTVCVFLFARRILLPSLKGSSRTVDLWSRGVFSPHSGIFLNLKGIKWPEALCKVSTWWLHL